MSSILMKFKDFTPKVSVTLKTLNSHFLHLSYTLFGNPLFGGAKTMKQKLRLENCRRGTKRPTS